MNEWLQHILIGIGTAIAVTVLWKFKAFIHDRSILKMVMGMIHDRDTVLSVTLLGVRPSKVSEFTSTRDMLYSEDPYIRSTGIELLADTLIHLHPPARTAARVLSQFSGDKNNRVRANVAHAMHRFDPAASRMIVQSMAETDDPFMLLSAAWLCGELRDLSLLDVLMVLSGKAGHVLRDRILKSLESIRGVLDLPAMKDQRLVAISKIKAIQDKLLRTAEGPADTLNAEDRIELHRGHPVPAGTMADRLGQDPHQFIPAADAGQPAPAMTDLPEVPLDPASFDNLKIAMELLGEQGRMGSSEIDRLKSLIRTRELEFRSKFLEIEKGKQEVMRLISGGQADGPVEEMLPTEALIESNYLRMMVEQEDQILQINKEFKDFLHLKERLRKHLQ